MFASSGPDLLLPDRDVFFAVDTQFERRTATGEIGEECDGPVDDDGVEHLVSRVIVPGCNALPEVVFRHGKMNIVREQPLFRNHELGPGSKKC